MKVLDLPPGTIKFREDPLIALHSTAQSKHYSPGKLQMTQYFPPAAFRCRKLWLILSCPGRQMCAAVGLTTKIMYLRGFYINFVQETCVIHI